MRTTTYLLFILAGAFGLPAATISNVTVTNLSSPDSYSNQAAIYQNEFRSANVATSPVAVNGNLTSFTNQFSWFAGIRTGLDSPDITFAPTISYEISFTVNDPGNTGYLIFVSTESRGWLTLEYLPESFSGTYMTAEGTALDAEVSAGGMYFNAPNLSVTGLYQMADENITSVNELVTNSSAAISNAQSGTDTFYIRFTSSAVSLFSSQLTTGEASLRWGLNPTIPELALSTTPGFDGETADQLGHFVTISMFSNNEPVTGVPEPSTSICLGLLFSGAFLYRYNKTSKAAKSQQTYGSQFHSS
jgi:hypothetical protein